jgi:hypothetical protein
MLGEDPRARRLVTASGLTRLIALPRTPAVDERTYGVAQSNLHTTDTPSIRDSDHFYCTCMYINEPKITPLTCGVFPAPQ